jgi:hypothetical protein
MARETDKRWKGILIDWPTIADMDAIDYELKPLNQQQVAILLALLSYQKWPTRWTGLEMSKSELETYIADIEQRLMRNEGGEMATKDDIRDGMYEAMNRLAAQVVSGRYINIAVGDDGTVTDPTETEGESSVEDDPTTPDIDESLASTMGGSIAVCRALEKYLDKCDSLYGAVNGTPATTLAAAQSIIKAYFENDGAIMDSAISAYYSYRATQNQIAFNTSAAFEGYMYCRGHDERAFNKWLIDSSGYAETKRSMVSDMVIGLSEEFFTNNFVKGAQVPSTAYRAASCTKIQTENWTYPMQAASVAYVISGVLKANHRYQFDFSGSFTDVDNPNIVQDAFYSHNLTTGVKTYIGFTWSISGITAPVSADVPFKADHVYTVSLEKTGGDNNGTLTKLNNFTTPANSVGTITAKMTDNGEFGL